MFNIIFNILYKKKILTNPKLIDINTISKIIQIYRSYRSEKTNEN